MDAHVGGRPHGTWSDGGCSLGSEGVVAHSCVCSSDVTTAVPSIGLEGVLACGDSCCACGVNRSGVCGGAPDVARGDASANSGTCIQDGSEPVSDRPADTVVPAGHVMQGVNEDACRNGNADHCTAVTTPKHKEMATKPKETARERKNRIHYAKEAQTEEDDKRRLQSLAKQLATHTAHLKRLEHSLQLVRLATDAEENAENLAALSNIDREMLEMAGLIDGHATTKDNMLGSKKNGGVPIDAERQRKKGVSSLKSQIHMVRGQMRRDWQSVATLTVRAKSATFAGHDALAEAAAEDTASKKPQALLNPECTSADKTVTPGEIMLPGMAVSPRKVYFRVHRELLSALSNPDGAHDADDDCQICSLLPHKTNTMQTERRYQSMQAELSIGAAESLPVALKVIVDSGAAWSCMGMKVLLQHYPQLVDKLKKDKATFIDAQGRLMPVRGYVEMHVCVAEWCFWTRVYIFETLGVDFLLGVNSLVDGDLLISARQRKLISAVSPHESVPVVCESTRRTTTSKDVATVATASCGCGTPCGQPIPPAVMHVNRQTNTLLVGGTSIPCDTVYYTQPIPELTPPANRVPVRCNRRTVIPAIAKAGERVDTSIVGKYDEWFRGAERGIMIEPTEELRQLGLEVPDLMRQSSLNASAQLTITSRSTKPIVVPRGFLLGYARDEAAYENATNDNSILFAAELEDLAEVQKLPFAQGGPPVSDADFAELELNFTDCINPFKPIGGGKYAPLEKEWVDKLKTIATRWWMAWSRDTRAPRISRLVEIEVPTGDAVPVAQRPYPVHERYREAMKKEIQKLLDAGLIEPGLGNWASPALLTVKKDSTADELKVKIVVDFRLLNSVTQRDEGGLGNQAEILRRLGGAGSWGDVEAKPVSNKNGQRCLGIGDLAGGFYQYALASQADREKTAFILPSSMGSTLYQWTVTRNPASYSRGIQFALQGMDDVHLDPLGESRGGVHSWIDDIIFHTDTLEGFMDAFERILRRLCYCGLTLKASKCELLRNQIEVLGYLATPDGLKMNPKKVTDFLKRWKVYPSSRTEILSYLGGVNFYRRFIPRIALLSKPLTDALKKKAGHVDPEGIRTAVDAINRFLVSGEVLAAPDYSDPNAEFVMCTDACDIAVGAVLMQWQWTRPGPSPAPPADVHKRATGDPLYQSWRLKAGYKLMTISFFSRVLDQTQSHWNVFDKEGGAILLAVRENADIISGYPTTIYTDSSVAQTMLNKQSNYKGTPRLQRWGIELMSYAPHLKIGFRRGVDNGMADLLSRYPYFKKYVKTPEDVIQLPKDEVFDRVAEAQFSLDKSTGVHVRLTVSPLLPSNGESPFVQADVTPRRDYFELLESRSGGELGEIWQKGRGEPTPDDPDSVMDMLLATVSGMATTSPLQPDFLQEQEKFEEQQSDWDLYVDAFKVTMGRAPVLYDLYCGEGGYSRGARASGLQCYGFDNCEQFRPQYETDPAYTAEGHLGCTSSGMKFQCRDVDHQSFWDELQANGRIGTLPAPDLIHCSPPCGWASKLNRLNCGQNAQGSDAYETGKHRVETLIGRLQRLEAEGKKPLLWQVENVPESVTQLQADVSHVLVSGTMMGHRVFRKRVFFTNYAAEVQLPANAAGKRVGSRGVTLGGKRTALNVVDDEDDNMYGIYSRRQEGRGSYDEWHGALGHLPGTYSRAGIAGVLPLGYGRYLSSQMVAHWLRLQFDTPVISPPNLDLMTRACLQEWAVTGVPGRAQASGNLHELGRQHRGVVSAQRHHGLPAIPEGYVSMNTVASDTISGEGKVSSRLRTRYVPESRVQPCDVAQLPAAPCLGLIELDGEYLLAELTWRREDGLDTADFLRPWLSEEFLRETRLRVILTYKCKGGHWEPWLIACEDHALRDAGYPDELGLFAARPFACGEVVDSYDGKWLGNGIDGSKAYDRLVDKALRGRVSSYLYQTDGVKKGTVRLFDGSTGRDGGAKRANSARGTPFKDVVFIDHEGDMVVRRKVGVVALQAHMAQTS